MSNPQPPPATDDYTAIFGGPGRDNSTLGWAKFTGELAYHGPRTAATVRRARAQVARLLSKPVKR